MVDRIKELQAQVLEERDGRLEQLKLVAEELQFENDELMKMND